MFDARKLLDAFVGVAAQLSRPPGQQAHQPQPPSGQAQDATTIPTMESQGGSTIAGQVDRTLRQVTGQGTGEVVQRAKDVMAQNPALAPAVMVGLAGLFSAKRRSGGMPGAGLAKLGALALIGTLAYKAYQNSRSGKPLLDAGGIAGALGGAGQGQPAPEPAAQSRPGEAQPGQADRPAAATPETAQASQPVAAHPIPEGSQFHPASQTEDDALLYLRAMIAAASADGRIDDAERARILKGVAEAGIDSGTTRWLEREMASPADVEELSANVNTPERAAQVYAAARIAIDPDTMQEREFLRQLAEALDLDQATRAQIDHTADTGT